MNIDFINIYNGIGLGKSLVEVFIKILACLLLFAGLFYSFMLILKLRVLRDTMDISSSGVPKLIVVSNLIVSLVGSILALILILL